MSRPRIRSLKPELWQDEKVGGLTRDARLLFIGLITMADDEGRLRALPALVLGHVFPYDIDALKKVAAWMGEITESGLIEQYEVAGTPYVQIIGWSKHQVMSRMTPSDLPGPESVTGAKGSVTVPFKKAAIPERVRREVAKRAGAVPGETVPAQCTYCDAEGTINWPRLSSGKPGSWVSFTGLELDHVHPEFHGGTATAENIVLACRRCNRSKGHGVVADSAPATATDEARSGNGVPSRAPADRIGSEGIKNPPLPPEGGRKRDLAAFKEDMQKWAASTYPDLPPHLVAGAVQRIRASRADVTPERVRHLVHRMDPTLTERAA